MQARLSWGSSHPPSPQVPSCCAGRPSLWSTPRARSVPPALCPPAWSAPSPGWATSIARSTRSSTPPSTPSSAASSAGPCACHAEPGTGCSEVPGDARRCQQGGPGQQGISGQGVTSCAHKQVWGRRMKERRAHTGQGHALLRDSREWHEQARTARGPPQCPPPQRARGALRVRRRLDQQVLPSSQAPDPPGARPQRFTRAPSP